MARMRQKTVVDRVTGMWIVVVLLAIGALLTVVWLGWPSQPSVPQTITEPFSELIEAVAQNQPGAAKRIQQRAAEDWAGFLDNLHQMISHPEWRVRSVAGKILADRPDPSYVGFLLPLCSDRDWRVRAVAFRALSRIGPLSEELPMRDTPLDDRERLLLSWLDRHRELIKGRPADICESYAGASRAEFGRPMAARCLSCHAGQSPASIVSSDACSSCHSSIHRQWKRSAHAQSLTHLRLTTVNPTSRQVETMGFGQMRGLNCIECHQLDKTEKAPDPVPTVAGERCPYRFDPAKPPAGSCLRCHETTSKQWKSWLDGVQPRMADWPPGQVDLDFRGDRRSCTDCHMQTIADANGKRFKAHQWMVRRAPELLSDGINLQALPGKVEGGRLRAQIVLTNLSGHDYPTGTRRRAIRLFAGPTEDELRVVATLSPMKNGQPSGRILPSLNAGEQRTFAVDLPADADVLHYRLVYYRNRFVEGGYEVEILAGAFPLGR